MMAEAKQPDQMEVFAGLADEIEPASGPDHEPHVRSCLQCILREDGLVQSDGES